MYKNKIGSRLKRRLRTKRRSKKLRGGFVKNTTSKELSVFVNPFSTATNAPKIPDNSVNSSYGISLRGLNVHRNDIIGYILMRPNQDYHTASKKNAASLWTEISSGMTLMEPTASFQKWRGVSFGMKISMLKDHDHETGTWQAIRFHGHKNDATDDAAASHIANENSWPNDPTFSSGTLATLSRQKFMCNPLTDEYPWVTDLTQKMDHNFDCILVRIVTTNLVGFLVSSFGNFEAIYKDATAMKRLQTTTLGVSPDVLAKAKQAIFNKCKKAAH
jgi:hypothetical protein